MDLSRRLKQARAKPRQPFRRSAFTVVAALVREHNLDESFLDRVQELAAQGNEWVWSYEPRPKEPFQPPLYALVDAGEFRLTQAILAAVDNPYVPFAHSPDELPASWPLFHLNSGLSPAILGCVHFRTLLAREMVQAKLKEKGATSSPVHQTAMEALLNRLNEFIDYSTHQAHRGDA